MNSQLFCEDSQGNRVELTPKGTNRINLGEVRKGFYYQVSGVIFSWNVYEGNDNMHYYTELYLVQVEINEKAIRSLFIFNSGKFNFDYTWELMNKTKTSRKVSSEVSISPESGTVLSNTRKRCQLVFCPLTRVSLQGCDLLLRVRQFVSFKV